MRNRRQTNDKDLNLGVSKKDFKRLTKKITELGVSYEKSNK